MCRITFYCEDGGVIGSINMEDDSWGWKSELRPFSSLPNFITKNKMDGYSHLPSFIAAGTASRDSYSSMLKVSLKNSWYSRRGKWEVNESSLSSMTMAVHLSYMTHRKLMMPYFLDLLHCSSGFMCYHKEKCIAYNQNVARPEKVLYKTSANQYQKKCFLALVSGSPEEPGVSTTPYPVYRSNEKEAKIFDFHCPKCGYDCKSTCPRFPSSPPVSPLRDSTVYDIKDLNPRFYSQINPNQEFIFIDLLGSWKGSGLGGVLLKKFLSICGIKYPGLPVLLHPLDNDTNLINYYSKFGFKLINFPHAETVMDVATEKMLQKSGKGALKESPPSPLSFDGVLPTCCLFFSFSNWSSLRSRQEINGLMFYSDG
jgi:hypothetical protein